MSLLAASAAAYNKKLSLRSHFVLHLGFDPRKTKLEGLFGGPRYISCLLLSRLREILGFSLG